MSHYDWESGTIVIPRREFRKLVDRLVTTHNNLIGRIKQQVQHAYEAACRHTGPEDRRAIMERHLGQGLAHEFATVCCFDPTSRRVHAPKWSNLEREHLAPVGKRPTHINAIGGEYGCTEGAVIIDWKGHAITWRVGENNHACDNANATDLARALWSALHCLTWTRGTGGEVVGNDEYNRDNEDAGGGANYRKHSYGPQRAANRRRSWAA